MSGRAVHPAAASTCHLLPLLLLLLLLLDLLLCCCCYVLMQRVDEVVTLLVPQLLTKHGRGLGFVPFTCAGAHLSTALLLCFSSATANRCTHGTPKVDSHNSKHPPAKKSTHTNTFEQNLGAEPRLSSGRIVLTYSSMVNNSRRSRLSHRTPGTTCTLFLHARRGWGATYT